MGAGQTDNNHSMTIGSRTFQTSGHTYVMGILNVTPDSFSDGGRYQTMDEALFQTERMLSEGADVIDVGGESTRPGYVRISDEEEIERVCAVIEHIRTEFDPVISVDTYKSAVAEKAVLSGAVLLNDIWGFRFDPEMANVAAKHRTACCLMHNRVKPQYRDLMSEVKQDLQESLAIAAGAGVAKERVILDPGIGFGKTKDQNLEIIGRLTELRELGYSLLLGASRKSVIGLTLDLPVEKRLEGTLATTAFAVLSGCMFVRVHDVGENVRFIRMMEAVLQSMPAGRKTGEERLWTIK